MYIILSEAARPEVKSRCEASDVRRPPTSHANIARQHRTPRFPTVYAVITVCHRLPTVSLGIPRYPTDFPPYPTLYTVSRYATDVPRYPTDLPRNPTVYTVSWCVCHRLPTGSLGIPQTSHGIPRCIRFHGIPPTSHGIPQTCRGIPPCTKYTVSRYPTNFPRYPTNFPRYPGVSHGIPPTYQSPTLGRVTVEPDEHHVLK